MGHSETPREGSHRALPLLWAWDGLLVGLAAILAYGWLAPSVSGDGDGSEMTLALVTGGIPHPTGYPLYILFGHAFVGTLTSLGVGGPKAANLWSALGAAVALGLLQILARRLASGTQSRTTWAAAGFGLVPVALLALNPIWTNEALLAEVYAWHLAWVLACALLFVAGVRELGGPERLSTPRLRRLALGWGFVIGLGLAHHLTSLVVSLPLTLTLGWSAARRRSLKPGLVALGLLAATAPLMAGYGWLAWQAGRPTMGQWPVLGPTAHSILDHITGAQYRHFLGRFAPSEVHAQLLRDAGYPVLAVGALALVATLVRPRAAGERAVLAGLAAAAAAVTLSAFRYGVPDPAPYFLPAMTLAVSAITPALLSLFRSIERSRAGQALLLGALGAALALLAGHWGPRTADRLRDLAAFESMARSMWATVPEDAAIVLWPDDRYHRLREYQLLRGEKPKLYVTTPDMLVNDRPRADFAGRFGFDPLAGLTLPVLTPGQVGERAAIDRFLVSLVRNVTDRCAGAVILVDPSVPTVRQLRRSTERP